MFIDDLIVTQNGLRNPRQVSAMIEFVKAGGKFTYDARLAQHFLSVSEDHKGFPPPMHISMMEDGRKLLHDGHHRAVAMWLGGRRQLDPSEYESAKYTYADYSLPHPDRGWYTPFDVDLEVRLPDFSLFKRGAAKVYDVKGDPAAVDTLIMDLRHRYCEDRRIWRVSELVESYLTYAKRYKRDGRRNLRTVR